MRSSILPILPFFISFLSLFSSFAQNPQEWKWQNPMPLGTNLKDVQLVDSQIAFAVGEAGTILKSTNGGVTWIRQNSGTSNWLNSVHFINSQIGWVAGDSGAILKTTNGGLSWITQNSGSEAYLKSVYFVNGQTGWAVGGNTNTPVDINSIILKTSNGGLTWFQQLSEYGEAFSGVQFTDDQNGWVVHRSRILKTSNGGTNWVSHSYGSSADYLSAHFSNPQSGMAVGKLGNTVKTSNGGVSWNWQTSGTDKELRSIFFSDAQNVWAVGSNGTIIKSSNGANTWSAQISGTDKDLNSVHFFNAQNGLAVGDGGTIVKTTDGGTSWIRQGTGPNNQLYDVHFVNNQLGWAVGRQGTILKTTNSGRSWNRQNSGVTSDFSSVFFINDQTGWAVSYEGKIVKTTTGGVVWSSQNSGTSRALYSVHFIDDQNGFAVGGNSFPGGILLRTTNGGTYWYDLGTSTTPWLFDIQFLDATNGWAVGEYGSILRTTDGANSWIPQNSGTTKNLLSVQFLDAQNGYVVGDGTILKTTNGGTSWIHQNAGFNGIGPFLYSVHFTDVQNGWIVGDIGTIFKTTNAGASWIKNFSVTGNTLWSVEFTDPLHGWIVGGNGTILTTTTNNSMDTEIRTSMVSGNLFEKGSGNCNVSPIPVKSRLVKALPGPYYGVSNNLGKYDIQLPLSDSTSHFVLQGINFEDPVYRINVVCPPTNQQSVSLGPVPDTVMGKDFGFEITQCQRLEVQVASNRRRRCFQNLTGVSYQNLGSVSANDAYILVEFPHWVRPVSATRAYEVINDSVWKFNLGTVPAGESNSFVVTDSVLCGNVDILGWSQCTKATIFPVPDCPSPNWNGAAISTSGKCLGNNLVRLGIFNRTSSNMMDSTDYYVYIDSILVKQAKVKLLSGDSLILNVSANGSGVHLVAHQVALHPVEIYSTTTVESCSQLPESGISTTLSTHFPLSQSPNSKTQCLPILGAYDPNDKQVFPQGFTNQNIIAPNTKLDYLVRFQNTGNDTAFTVYVIDTLDQNLNVESFEMGAASHPFELSMQTVSSGKTLLRWQFNNILLPDSNTNQLKSNGFIQFRISPKPGLALGSKVRNHAEIYFDFNPPIITNQTLSTFDVISFRDSTLNNNVQVVTSLPGKLSPKQIGVNLYPNPVTEHLLTAEFSTKGSLTLFNAQGQQVYLMENLEGKNVLPVKLKNGFYMARLRTDKGVSVVKVVVE